MMMNALPLQPDVHAPIAVGLVTMLLMLPDFLCQMCILFHAADPFDIVVVAALGHDKVFAHYSDWVFFPMPVYDFVLYYIIDGLTEKGQEQKKLIVPYQVNGLYVKGFTAEVFAGKNMIEEITL